MSEHEEKPEESVTEEGEKVHKNTHDVLVTIAERIKTSGPVIRDRVINVMVEKKLQARAELVEKALIKLKDSEKALKKLGPDEEHYPEGSDKPVKFSSKARRDERLKAEQAKKKLEQHLEAVLSENANEEAYNKLSEVLAKSGA